MTFRWRRRPDDWASAHDRARALAAVQVDEPLDTTDQTWLDGHLSGCASCAAVAAAYVAQRAEIQSLRRDGPEPPRDLWARTAAAIEREATVHGRETAARRRHPAPVPLGAIAGVLVIAVVIGASLLSRPISPIPSVASPSPAVTVGPTTASLPSVRPTPINVTADNVGWMTLGADGKVDVFDAPVQHVCASANDGDCPPIAQPSPKSIQLPDQQPASINKSPSDQGLVVVDSSTKNGGGTVYALPATASSPTPTPTPGASATPLESATASVVPTPGTSASQPPATPTPEATPVSPPPSGEPTPSAVGSSASPEPTPTASVRVTASPGGGTIAIAHDVIVVGESEAYSADGGWFAFSARPANNSRGPDIYLWHTGDAEAHALTTDHRAVFSGWLDGDLLGSRVAAAPGKQDDAPTSFLIDPVTGRESALGSIGWRPSVDPRGRFVVYWDGSVAVNDAGTDFQPADGRLVIAPWNRPARDLPKVGGSSPSPLPSASPSTNASASSRPSEAAASATAPIAAASAGSPAATPVASEQPSASPSAAPSSSPSASALVPVPLVSTRIPDWDARWDETGTHLAVWIATDARSRIGDLTLYSVDPATGKTRSLHRVASLAGFSIGKGRLAWATPRGQDGQGSRLQVVAWTNDAVGSIESRESSEVLVVIR